MPQTNFTPVQLYRSATAAAAPLAANLQFGELALNYADEKMYFKNAANVVKLLASSSATASALNSVQLTGDQAITGTKSFAAVQVAGQYLTPYAMRNRIINGTGIVRQRGAVALTAGLQYGQADRMMASVAGATGISGNITAATLAGTSTGQGWGIGPATWTSGTFQLAQRIESYNVSDLNSKVVTFSGKLYHDIGSTRTVRIIIQKATAGVDNFSATSTIAETTVSIPTGVTTAFSFTTTLGSSDATNGIMVIALDNNTATVVGRTVYASDWQFELGATATPFEQRLIGTELALCQRYYWKTFPQNTAPADNVTSLNAIPFGSSSAASYCIAQIRFPQVMRAAPSLFFYNPAGGPTGQWRNGSNSASSIPSASNVGDSGFYLSLNSGAQFSTADAWYIQLAASAEL